MIEERVFIKSVSALRYLWRLFGGYVTINLMTLEVTFSGSWRKIKKAARYLDNKRICYRIKWVNTKIGAAPQITLMIDKISLRK